MKNMFCALSDLTNEASVESWFVDPLLKKLGYTSGDIKLKTSLKEIKVGSGSKSALFKPDYVIMIDDVPAMVVEAKSTAQSVDDYIYQCSSYCLELNKSFDYNPCHYFLISNGLETRFYQWDNKNPLLILDFADITATSDGWKKLVKLAAKKAITAKATTLRKTIEGSAFPFGPVSLDVLSQKFQKIHQYIWTKEKKSPSASFEELIKILFIKLKMDRIIHQKLGPNPEPSYSDMIFSNHWISAQTEAESPINDPLFRNLVRELEKEIQENKKKRIFDTDEKINLGRDTIKWIVKELQHIDLGGMEEDIHGRMFETFLDATTRGRELGQFFTPRDIVSLMVGLAELNVTKDSVSTVLDACCGSGGFLISAMAQMTDKANALKGLTNTQRDSLLDTIRHTALYGIDAGSDPAIHRIARMNMYLHGDGGSHIYHADSLDKRVGAVGADSIENTRQLTELRKILLEEGKRFDVILSNPPFSLKYSPNDEEQMEVLNQYELSYLASEGKKSGMLSSVMFVERYKDLVSKDGQILAVIDDSVLSGSSYAPVRDYIRENFIIIAVISLPGDAFRRASARVKTSILILRLKQEGETQSDVFMASSISLGLEGKVARRIGIPVAGLEEKKAAEAVAITDLYRRFRKGEEVEGVVPASRIADRLDVKYCIGDSGRRSSLWETKGYEVISIKDALTPASGRKTKVLDEDNYQFLRVNYSGEVTEGDLVSGEDCSYTQLYAVKKWDILLSNMGVGRGAVGIVPPHHEGKFVSNEYTILTAQGEEEAVFYVTALRSKEILGDILATTTGMNRGRIKWESIEDVKVPRYQPGNEHIISVVDNLKSLWAALNAFATSQSAHVSAVTMDLQMDGEQAKSRWLAFKPPE